MAVMVASMFVIIALMIALSGWRVQSLFGGPRRQEKLFAKSAVGCLRLAGVGCGLWLVPSTGTALMLGVMLATGEPVGIKEVFVGVSGPVLLIILMLSAAWFISEPVGIKEVFVGVSGPVLLIILMLSAAWFISATFVSPKGERAYDDYLKRVRSRLPDLAEPSERAYVQEQTLEVLAQLDTTLKSALLDYLSRSRLLTGPNRITLRGADFRGVDLRSLDLPDADLSGINFEQANLQGARLFQADLRGARLNRADLSRANLQRADLRHADLTDAVLAGTKLYGANIDEALVTPAQLNRARL
jgi:hypothetical protein